MSKEKMKILSIESLHVKTKVNKKSFEKAIRFARTLIDEKGKVTREINADGKEWKEIPDIDFYAKVDEIRNVLITKLKTELLKEVKKK